jgi:phage shock protein PspC (stress-responsive transcriptional regulator)
VCAAIGRATNTDPVLWRVLFAVLTLAGGLSIFLYVVGWLLIPAEGDTGSPLEALIGRGRSGTSPVLVVIVACAAGLSAGSFVFGQLRPVLIVAVLIAAAVVLANRGGLGRVRGTAGAAPPMSAPPPSAFEATATATATETVPPTDPGYRPPFAPHGPYASGPYPYPGLGTPPPPPSVPTKPARPPSRLGRFTLSLTLLALGLVALVDIVTSGRVPVSAYVAAALATVGLGLLIGAWFGRSRGLILLGLALSVLLVATSAVGDFGPLRGSAGNVTWAPTTMAELSGSYEHSLGNADLDLTQLNFDGTDKHVSARVGAGNLHVTVPRFVDVVVHAKVNVGNSNVFNSTWDGVNNPSRTITDYDTDGPGHGHLVLDLRVNAGTLEVYR